MWKSAEAIRIPFVETLNLESSIAVFYYIPELLTNRNREGQRALISIRLLPLPFPLTVYFSTHPVFSSPLAAIDSIYRRFWLHIQHWNNSFSSNSDPSTKVHFKAIKIKRSSNIYIYHYLPTLGLSSQKTQSDLSRQVQHIIYPSSSTIKILV